MRRNNYKYGSFEDIYLGAITYDDRQAMISLKNVAKKKGVALKLFEELSQQQLPANLIVQYPAFGATEVSLSFTMSVDYLQDVISTLMPLVEELDIGGLEYNSEVARISVEGMGMKTHAQIAAKVFETLGANHIDILLIGTSEKKISIIINRSALAQTITVLSEALNLQLSREEVVRKDSDLR